MSNLSSICLFEYLVVLCVLFKEMDYLRDKRLLAKEWLDKLKKSFSARAFNSNNRASLRKTTSSGEVSGPESGPPEKLRLEDMKLMVEEGQFICDVDGVQADENATAAEGGGTAPSRTAQARELNKAQTAVTAAEEVSAIYIHMTIIILLFDV